MTGRPILTAAEMRAAEEAEIAAGTSVDALMDRAGKAAAEAIWRYAGPLPTLVLCGPGNNGGDGYVIARELAARGVPVRVAALADPQSAAARAARESWPGAIETLADAKPGRLLIDALFGTGLGRPLAPDVSSRLADLARNSAVRVAVDLPSGVATDNGAILSPVPDYDLTITFQTLKPSHLLQPAARYMGRLVVADIGIPATSKLTEIGRPRLLGPDPEDNKFSRGDVAVVAGEMPGASALTAAAAAKAGAGYVNLITDGIVAGIPHAIVQRPLAAFDDDRVDVMVLGPGFGLGEKEEARFDGLLQWQLPLVLDAGALTLLGLPERLKLLPHVPIITPHGGEYAGLFGGWDDEKVEHVRKAAVQSGAVVLLKGADTVVAAPDGRAAIYASGPSWLATAGTGDVLTGIIATMRAQDWGPFEAACAGLWLHGRAAQLAGPAMIADDLLAHLPAAVAECL